MKTYMSLFSGAGVGCVELKKYGFECVATNELIPKRLDVQKYNKKCQSEDGYVYGDITKEETKKKLRQAYDNFKQKYKINNLDLDLLIATPPCQGMSVANHKKNNEIKRNSLVVESIALTMKYSPKVFVFENVRAFLTSLCTDLDGEERKITDVIDMRLGGNYHVMKKVINFKNYGANSSRTRTLVIGVRRDINSFTPYNLFPDISEEKTLHEVIGDLPALKIMGESLEDDLFHNFRNYTPHMREWIQDVAQGMSAFDNKNIKLRPHQIINGRIIVNQNKNGDKYKRQEWNKCAPCIHTRNDILASQNTVHPADDRVFSIRELMRMMNIPDDFKWTPSTIKELNKMNAEERSDFFKEHELNIRQCIGESVPSVIFSQIAKKIKVLTEFDDLSDAAVMKLITSSETKNNNELLIFLNKHKELNLNSWLKVAEFSNAKRSDNAAFYTPQSICFSVVNELPDFKDDAEISILEPSIGNGAFLDSLFQKYKRVKKVNLVAYDIDSEAIEACRKTIEKIGLPENFSIEFKNEDFLLANFNERFDIVIGNPPFGKVNSKHLLDEYKKHVLNNKTNNIYSYFIEKSMRLGSHVALITPKTILNVPEFKILRELISSTMNLHSILDYNEFAFNVKVETICIVMSIKKKQEKVKVVSYLNKKCFFVDKDYITQNQFGCWLLYRNKFFDDFVAKMKFDVFDVFRDRQITKRMTSNNGRIRVLKSRNVQKDGIYDIKDYDQYLDNLDDLSVKKILNKDNIVLVPNLSYYPRAQFLPKNTITDGSLAVLFPKTKVVKADLEYFSSKEFHEFYRIARNFGTRSLNIDQTSVKFFGLRRLRLQSNTAIIKNNV